MKTKMTAMAGLVSVASAAACVQILLPEDPIRDPCAPKGCEVGGGAGAGTTTEGGAGTSTTGGGAGGSPECTNGSTQPCYSGPAGTKDVGICEAGMQTCQADGTWGPCTGEVLPGVETCASEKNEDCNTTECALWSKVFGDSSTQGVLDMAVDPSGDILVLGWFKGELSGVQPALDSAGLLDLFLLKLTPNGDVLWSKRWGDVDNQNDGKLAVDGAGNVILAGTFQGTLDFGNGYVLPPKGGNDIYVAKLNADGDAVWAKGIGDSKAQLAWDVAVDDLGDIFVVGAFSGTVDFGDGMVTSAGLHDAFVVKYGGNGTPAWKRVMGDAMTQIADSVTVDPAGDIVFTGLYQGSLVFDSTTFSNSGHRFVAKISKLGADEWLKDFSVESAQVAASPDGTYWVAGEANGVANFGGGELPPLGASDIYVAKFESTGAYAIAKRFGGAGNEEASDIVIDGSGAVLVAATGDSGIDFGGDGALLSAGLYDVFVAKFDEKLNLTWARRFGDAQYQGFGHLSVDSNDFIYLGCQISGTVNFGAGDLVSNGDDAAVAQLAP